MKELLENWESLKNEFYTKEKEIEGAFGEFLESIPDWRDRLGSIIVSFSYDYPKDIEDIGEVLIPEVCDINLCGDRVSFKIRIPGRTWVKEYIEIGLFPLRWLTNSETFPPIDSLYLHQKLERREKLLERWKEEEISLNSQIKETEDEIERIKKLLEKEEN